MFDLQIACRAVDAQFRIALCCTFWHSWRSSPASVHRCKSTADRSRFARILVLGAKGRDVPTQQQGLGVSNAPSWVAAPGNLGRSHRAIKISTLRKDMLCRSGFQPDANSLLEFLFVAFDPCCPSVRTRRRTRCSYQDDLQKLRSSCQKKKEFVQIESWRPRPPP
jgi:hypothetical protein